jgi:hypothetical protein
VNDGELPDGLGVVPLETAVQEVAAIEHKKKTRSSKSRPKPGAKVDNQPQAEASDDENGDAGSAALLGPVSC